VGPHAIIPARIGIRGVKRSRIPKGEAQAEGDLFPTSDAQALTLLDDLHVLRTTGPFAGFTNGCSSSSATLNSFGTIRARGGFTVNNWLLYATASSGNVTLTCADVGCPGVHFHLFFRSLAVARLSPELNMDLRRVTALPRLVVAPVALFCYRRSYLEEAALAVAATCDEEDLVEADGHLGRTLFLKSALFLKSRNVAFSSANNSSLNSLKAMALSLATTPKDEGAQEEDEGES
jgi:hypothetical protein